LKPASDPRSLLDCLLPWADLDDPVQAAARSPDAGSSRHANAARAKVRGHVEHVFAAQKHRMGLFVRTIGLDRATAKIGMANLAYNMRRFVWLEGRPAPA